MKKLKTIKILGTALFISALLFSLTSVITHAAVSPDAVAIRVLPNPYWLSSAQWYTAQGYTGSPQTTIVDGYDAIRDNRTVYVAALNVSSGGNIGYCTGNVNKSCDITAVGMGQASQCWENSYGSCSSKTYTCSGLPSMSCNMGPFQCGIRYGSCQKKTEVFSNIYVITYNEGADNNTVDIFGKILSAWKFNTNMNGLGTCFSADPSVAVATTTVGCKFDTDCPSQTFCDSDRAKLARDQKRITTFFALRDALNNYKNTSGHFPLLESGSYLKNATISTWPSWNGVFLPQLGVSASDPINTLGDCLDSNLEKATCWNPSTYKYYSNTVATNLKLPANSSAIVYTSNPVGSTYSLCFNREFQFLAVGGDANTVATINAIQNCNTDKSTSSFTNLAPRFDSATNFTVKTGDKLLGYIKISDPENDPINFSFSKTPTQLATYPNISILSTNDPKQLKIIANSVYNTPNSPVVGTLTISDTAGNSTSADIKVDFSAVASKPVITAPDVDYYLSAKPENAFNYTATIEAPANSFSSVGLSAPNFGVSTVVGLEHDFPVNVYLQGLKYKVENIGTDQASGLNQYQFRIYGNIVSNSLNTPAVDNDKKYTITVGTVTKDFTIHFHANAPQLAMQCNKQAAIFNTYNCQVINNNLSNKAVVYTTSTPTGKNFTINQNTGLLSGILTTSSTIPFTITAANEYGAKNTLSSDVTGFKYGCGMIELDGGPWDETGSLRNQDGYYRTIKLGDRCWLADNLRQDKNPAHTNGACRDNSNINCDAEGSVYPTTDASNASLCPSGWHVANDYNYQQLLDSVGGDITVLELNGLAGINLLLNGQKYLTDSNCIPAGGYTYGKNYWTTGGGVNSPKNFSNFCIAATTGYLRCVQDIPCAQTCGAAQTCDLGSGLCVCKPTLSAANYPAYSQSCSGYLSDGCNNTVPNPGKLDCTKFGSTNNCDVNTGKCGACTNVGEIYSTVTKSCVCPNNMTAVNGQCACGLGVCNNAQTCSGGTCIAVTNTPTNCASGTVWDSIQNGCCKDPAWPAPAVYANKCTGITTAASAACHGAKLTINPGKFASCSGKCADEDDGCGNQCPDPCASGESCSGGVCTATADGPCKKDADCSGGQVCGAGGNCCKVHYAYDSDPGIRSRYCGPNPGKEYGSCYYSNDIDWGDWGADTPHMVSFDLLADQTHQFYKNLTPVACPAGSVCIANFCRNTGIACAESASNPATDSDLAGYLSMGMAGSCEVCLRSFIRLFDAVSYDDAHCIKDSKTAEVTCASDTSNCVSKGVYFKNQKTSDNSSCNNNPSSGCHTENICCGSAGVITSGQTGCIWDDAGCAGNSVFNTSIKNTQIFWGAGN